MLFRPFRLLVAAMLLTALAGCASSGKPFSSLFVRLFDMRGAQPFCVYDVDWNLSGWRSPAAPATPVLCTELKSRSTGEHVLRAGVGIQAAVVDKATLVLTYRRNESGPLQRVSFNLTGKLRPKEGWKLSALKPVFTETGVQLLLTQVRGNPAENLHFFDMEIGFQPDQLAP
jgi:hypothetical protein